MDRFLRNAVVVFGLSAACLNLAQLTGAQNNLGDNFASSSRPKAQRPKTSDEIYRDENPGPVESGEGRELRSLERQRVPRLQPPYFRTQTWRSGCGPG